MQWVSQKCVNSRLLSLQFDSILVYVGPPSKWEVETLIYSENRPKNTLSHVPRHVGAYFCTCAHSSGHVTK